MLSGFLASRMSWLLTYITCMFRIFLHCNWRCSPHFNFWFRYFTPSGYGVLLPFTETSFLTLHLYFLVKNMIPVLAELKSKNFALFTNLCLCSVQGFTRAVIVNRTPLMVNGTSRLDRAFVIMEGVIGNLLDFYKGTNYSEIFLQCLLFLSVYCAWCNFLSKVHQSKRGQADRSEIFHRGVASSPRFWHKRSRCLLTTLWYISYDDTSLKGSCEDFLDFLFFFQRRSLGSLYSVGIAYRFQKPR